MKRVALLCLFVILVLPGISLHAVTIAIADLEVESHDPRHEFLGKGIAELVSYEISKSPTVAVISRDQRAQILEEITFSLSGLGEGEQLELGRLVAARHILFGNIIDMGEVLIFSMRMIDVETGVVAWQETVTAELTRYDYIAATFASSALEHLGLRPHPTTLAKVEQREARSAEAAILFSEAVDSLDRDDRDSARRALSEARRADPESEAVRVFLARLAPAASKFKAEVDFYVPSQNPAALGTIQQDKIYLITSLPVIDHDEDLPKVDDGLLLDETGIYVVRLGYEFPLGPRWGVCVEVFFNNVDPKVELQEGKDAEQQFLWTWLNDDVGEDERERFVSFYPNQKYLGAGLSLGYALTDWLSLGFAFSLARVIMPDYEERQVERFSLPFTAGFYLSLLERRLLIDSHATINFQHELFLNWDRDTWDMEDNFPDGLGQDPDDYIAVVDTSHYPLIIESTVTGVLLDRRLFLVAKSIVDLYATTGTGSGRDGYMTRTIPSAEYWITDFLSLRGGTVFTWGEITGRSNSGVGAVAGVSLRLGKVEIDANYTYMERVSRLLPGYSTPDHRLLLQFSRSGNFITSR